MIPYRQQEILQALSDNKKGLTTPQIFKIASAAVGSELPDSSTVGKLCYSMRNSKPKLISTSDAVGGSVHKITGDGLTALAEAVGSKAQPQITEMLDEPETTIKQIPKLLTPDEAKQLIIEMEAELQPANTQTIVFDMTDELDQGMHRLVNIIKDCVAKEPMVITHQLEKIQLLKFISNTPLFSENVAHLINEMIVDYEQFQAAA